MVNENRYDILSFIFGLMTFIGFLLIIFVFVSINDSGTISEIIAAFIA